MSMHLNDNHIIINNMLYNCVHFLIASYQLTKSCSTLLSMDSVIQQFLSQASPQTLIDYRDAMRHFSDDIRGLFASSFPPDSADADQRAVIGTGSFVEGADMARVFSADETIVNEVELDFMYQMMMLDPRVFEVVPLKDCPIFAHIKCNATHDQLSQVRQIMAAQGTMEEFVNKCTSRKTVAIIFLLSR